MKNIYLVTAIIGSCVGLWATDVSARTVTLDFEGGENQPGNFGNSDGDPKYGYGYPYNTEGTWLEDGFEVNWTYDSAYDYGDGPIPPDFNQFRSLSPDGTVFSYGHGYEMSVSKADGGTFSLSGLGADFSYDSFIAVAFFEPEAGSSHEATRFIRPVLNRFLSVSGVTADGTTVSTLAGTTNALNWRGDHSALSDDTFYFSASDAQFSPGSLSMFEDLVSLSISVEPYDFLGLAAIKSFVDFGAPEILLQGLEAGCDFNTPTVACNVAGLGDFTYYVDNWDGGWEVYLSEIELTLGDHPAPVPIPATLPLMLAALGGFGWIRRQKRNS